MCKSFGGFEVEQKVQDPREIKTWPITPEEDERGPPEALPDPHPDNVYSVGLTQEQMKQMKFLSKRQPHKPI